MYPVRTMRPDRNVLNFQISDTGQSSPLEFDVTQIVCAGYSGRSQDAVMQHVHELVELGMTAPESVPIFFRVSNYLALQTEVVTVQDRFTSGEVEFVFLFDRGETYVTCGSDHTGRSMERYSIPGSKQMYPKILPREVWRLKDVEDHWDELILRSWAVVMGTRALYQESAVSSVLQPSVLLRMAEARFPVRSEGSVFMSGTVPTTSGGMVYADRFEFEVADPVKRRS